MSLPLPTPAGGAPATPAASGGGRQALQNGWTQTVTFYRILRANPLTFVGFLMVAAIIIAAVIMLVDPHLLVHYAPNQLTTNYNQPPSWQHPMGTDGLGSTSGRR